MIMTSSLSQGMSHHNKKSVIIIRAPSSSESINEEEDSSADDPCPFPGESCPASPAAATSGTSAAAAASHHSHHPSHHHSALISSSSPSGLLSSCAIANAVKKDVNLSSSLRQRMVTGSGSGGLHGGSNRGLRSGGHVLRSSLMHPYCESPSFLLDPDTIRSSSQANHIHHHLVTGSDDDDEDMDNGHHVDDEEEEECEDMDGSCPDGGRVSRLSSETVTDPDLMFSCDVRDVVVVTPSISSIMSEDAMEESVAVVAGSHSLRPNQKYHMASSSSGGGHIITTGSSHCSSSSKNMISSSSSSPASGHNARSGQQRQRHRHRHQSVVDDLDDEADVVAAAAARVVRHHSGQQLVRDEEEDGNIDEEEDDPVACMDDGDDGMGGLSLGIKHEKLLTVAVVDDDDDDDDDVSCILRDPPLNHFKPTRITSGVAKGRRQVQHPIHSQAPQPPANMTFVSQSHQTASHSATFLKAAQPNRAPDSSSSSSRAPGQLSALQQRSPLLGSLIANGVSSTTSPPLTAGATIPTPASATVVLTAAPGIQNNNTTSIQLAANPMNNQPHAEHTAGAITVTTGQQAVGMMQQQALDIKILPAGIIQLASNLSAIFPNAGIGGNGQQKQQIAIQLLREDGTSIILPITTTSRAIIQQQQAPAATLTIKQPETTTVLLQADNSAGARQTIITTQSIGQQPQQIIQHTIAQQPQQSPSSTAIITAGTNGQFKVTAGGANQSCNNVSSQSCGQFPANQQQKQSQNQQQDSNSSSDSSDRPFKCELCNSTFTRLGNYTRHKKIHSLPTKEDQRFRCEICSKSFIQRCDLARHLHIHRGTEPHRCPQCGKGYIRHSDLVTHQRFHNKEKPFACPSCSKGFCQRGDLNRHLRSIHLQLKPILCSHCHKKFAKEETLLRHINSTHRDKLLE